MALDRKLELPETIQNTLTEDYYNNINKIPEKLGIAQRDLGAFYTDREVVNYILRHLKVGPNTTILDPACGCGSFLFPLYHNAVLREKPSFLNIYGVDIDERAVNFTRMVLKSIIGSQSERIAENHVILGDFVFNRYLGDFSTSKIGILNDMMNKGGFDYIIGNPPYNVKNVTKKKVELTEDLHKKIADKTKNMPIYFIFRALELLKEGGTIAFVLPKSLLYVKKYDDFRKYILRNFIITRITEIGIKFKGVRGEQVIVFIKKSQPTKSRSTEFVSIYKPFINLKQASFSLSQTYFLDKHSIPVFSDPDIFKAVEHINHNSDKFSNFVEYRVFRGLPLSVTEINETSLDVIRKSDNYCIRGRDIAKGRLKRVCFFNLKAKDNPKIEELRKPKIVMQNIYSSESGIISYLDQMGIITTETVTNVFISDHTKLKFIYALLNSKLINFYLFNAIFSRSRLTMHMDGHYLGQIPVVWKEKSDEVHEIVRIVDKIKNCKESELKGLFSRIDALVYSLFGLNQQLIKIVETAMSTVLSRRSK
jgi:type I restriction-modification system DNA methylase subunit